MHVFFNKPFKQSLRKKYNEYVSYLASNGLLKTGDTVTVSREVLIDFVCSSFDEYNAKNKHNKEVSKGFEIYGLNPFCLDDSKFQRHLNSLDENRIYDALTRNQEAVVCAGVDVLIQNQIKRKDFYKRK